MDAWRSRTSSEFVLTTNGLKDGDEVTCVATITDEPHQDATTQSTSITLINTPPLMTGVTLTATPGTDNGNALYNSDILCEAEGYSDIDGDDLVPTYSWTVGGNLSAETSNTLSGTFDVGTEIVCEIQSSDGKEDGPLHSQTITVANTVPVMSSITISTDSADGLVYEDTTLTVDSDYSDVNEEQEVSVSYEWFVGSDVDSVSSVGT